MPYASTYSLTTMTRLYPLLLCICLATSLLAQETQNFEWAHRQVNYEDQSIAVDDEGYIYTTGNLFGVADLDPSENGESISSSSTDIFVRKLSPDQELIWMKIFSSPASEVGASIKIDPYGNLLVLGEIGADIDFNPGGVGGQVDASSRDIFLLKMNADGDFLWVNSYGSDSDGEYAAINNFDVGQDGSIAIVADFTGSFIFGSGPNAGLVEANDNENILIAKIDPNGNLEWVKVVGGEGFDLVKGVKINSSGEVIASGFYTVSADFNPGSDEFVLSNPDELNTTWILKLSPQGDFVWAKDFESPDGYNEPFGFIIGSDESIYICGEYDGTIDADPGMGSLNLPTPSSQGSFFVKLDTDGNLIWAKSLSANISGEQIVLDQGDVLISGDFGGTIDFDPGEGSSFLSASNRDIYLLKLDNDNGDFKSVHKLGGSGTDANDFVYSDENSNVYVGGDFRGTMDFNPGAGIFDLSVSGTSNSFLIKLNQSGTVSDPWIIDNSSNAILDTLYTDASDSSDFYQFTVPQDGFINFSTCNAPKRSDNDFLNVYLEDTTNLVGSGTEGDCDGNVSWESSVQAGEIYLFEWGIDYSSGSLDEELEPIFFYTPDNEGYDCSTVIDIPCTGTYETDFRRLSQTFEWTAQSSGNFTFRLAEGSVPDPNDTHVYMVVYTGTCETASSFLGDNDVDAPIYDDDVSFSATAGTTYYVTLSNEDLSPGASSPALELIENGVETLTEVSITLESVLEVPVLFATEGADAYQWYTAIDDQPISGATFRKFTPTTNGDYYVTAVVQGCEFTSESLTVETSFSGGTDCTDAFFIYGTEFGSFSDTLIADVRGGSVFFEFYVANSGYVNLSSCKTGSWNSEQRLKIYNSDCTILSEEVTGNSGCSNTGSIDHLLSVTQDETYIFEWDLDPTALAENQIDSVFEFVFYYREDLQGTDCSTANTLNCLGEFELDLRGSEQWFTWVAPAVDEYILTVGPEDTDVLQDGLDMAVYTGSCGALTLVEDNSSDNRFDVIFFPTAGQTYYFRYGYPAEATKPGPYTGRLIGFGSADESYHEEVVAVECGDSPSYPFDGRFLEEEGIYHARFSSQAGCDSLVTLTLIVSDESEELNVSTCDSYDFDGVTLTESGSYNAIFQDQYSCDSTVNLHLTILPTDDVVEDVIACDNYEWQGETYTTSGQYQVLFTNQSGCDSIRTLNLTINEPDLVIAEVSTCEPSYEFDGQLLTETGRYQSTFINQAGCDSLVILNLEFPVDEVTQDISVCQSYEFDGEVLTASGQYNAMFTNQEGCDSLVTLNLTILEPLSGEETVSACTSYDWEGTSYSESGVYQQLLTSVAGCDSTATLNLTILESTSSEETVVSCESYDWNGVTYTTSGTYQELFTNAIGCDSTATLNLTINPTYDEIVNLEACSFYNFDGQTLTSSGQYNGTFQSTAGCDSLVTLNLAIVSQFNENVTIESCDSYEFDGSILTTSGMYHATFNSKNGCDSLVSLNLIILESSFGSEDIEVCDNYDWEGTIYNTSGTYQQIFSNSVGCDSTATLNLTILESTSSEETVSSCESYDWNGATYTTSGTYQEMFTNDAGCDSTATLNLTILGSTSSEETVSSCDSYDWNGTTYTTSGTYQEMFTNAAGCDSTATLNLTILESTSSEETVSSCESYDWNGATYTTSGTYQEMFTNAVGCDSTATLNLTILEPTSSEETVSSCESYDWNGATYTTSGTYQEMFTNAAGCDSTATLNLTILESTSSEETVSSCENYDWNGEEFEESGQYQRLFTSKNGCDSLITLNLTILDDECEVLSVNTKIRLHLYPNPTLDGRIFIGNTSLNGKEYSILDTSGKSIQKGRIKETITIKESEGVYVLIIPELNIREIIIKQ